MVLEDEDLDAPANLIQPSCILGLLQLDISWLMILGWTAEQRSDAFTQLMGLHRVHSPKGSKEKERERREEPRRGYLWHLTVLLTSLLFA